jgi:hypothetical protein
MNKPQQNPEHKDFLKKKRGRRPANNKENEPKSHSKTLQTECHQDSHFEDLRPDRLEYTEKVIPSPKNKIKLFGDNSPVENEGVTAKKENDEEIHTTLMKLFGSTMAMMMKLNDTVRSKVCVKCCCQNANPLLSQPFNPMSLPLPQYGRTPQFRFPKQNQNQYFVNNRMRNLNNGSRFQNMNFTSKQMTQMKSYSPK